jgi:hypothetical protein
LSFAFRACTVPGTSLSSQTGTESISETRDQDHIANGASDDTEKDSDKIEKDSEEEEEEEVDTSGLFALILIALFGVGTVIYKLLTSLMKCFSNVEDVRGKQYLATQPNSGAPQAPAPTMLSNAEDVKKTMVVVDCNLGAPQAVPQVPAPTMLSNAEPIICFCLSHCPVSFPQRIVLRVSQSSPARRETRVESIFLALRDLSSAVTANLTVSPSWLLKGSTPRKAARR